MTFHHIRHALSMAIAGLALAAAPAIAGTPASPEARLQEALAGRTAGAPVSCIMQHRIDSTRIFDRTAILYRTDDGTLYVNRPNSGASSLSRGDVLVTDTHTPQLCNVDIVRLVDQGTDMVVGTVGLGQFVPYAKPDKTS